MLKKILFSIIAFVLLSSCGGTGRPSEPNLKQLPLPPETPVNIEIPFKNLQLKYENILSKTYEYAKAFQFTDTCGFNFGCDCCFGEMIFNPDSTFYYLEYCMSDLSCLNGNFFIKNNQLNLEFSGQIRTREYNWDYEFDTTVIEYFLKDTIVSEWTQTFEPKTCNNKITLQSFGEKENYILAETNDDYQSGVLYLKNERLIE